MKKASLYSSAVFILAGSTFLFGCSTVSDPNPKPEINFEPLTKTISLAPGDSVNKLKILVTSFDKLKSFTIAKSRSSQLIQNVTSFPEKSYKTVLRDQVALSKDSGDQIIYTFTAITEEEETTTRTYTVIVK